MLQQTFRFFVLFLRKKFAHLEFNAAVDLLHVPQRPNRVPWLIDPVARQSPSVLMMAPGVGSRSRSLSLCCPRNLPTQ